MATKSISIKAITIGRIRLTAAIENLMLATSSYEQKGNNRKRKIESTAKNNKELLSNYRQQFI